PDLPGAVLATLGPSIGMEADRLLPMCRAVPPAEIVTQDLEIPCPLHSEEINSMCPRPRIRTARKNIRPVQEPSRRDRANPVRLPTGSERICKPAPTIENRRRVHRLVP